MFRSFLITLTLSSTAIITFSSWVHAVEAFIPLHDMPSRGKRTRAALQATANKLSPLPQGISPFEKSESKYLDIQADFRRRAQPALENAVNDGVKLCEIEFPPLLGGEKSKSQFDDFDNIQELDKNRDWSVQFSALLMGSKKLQLSKDDGKLWLIFPDLKECEIAKTEWAGNRFRSSTFTTIEAVTNFLQGDGSYDAPWGSAIASTFSKVMGGDKGDAGFLGDQNALDPLTMGDNAPSALSIVVQPGNGGPVEDWINLEKIYEKSRDSPMVIVNGALDKVRGGYYPAVFFPKLAKTVDTFFNKFEPVFYLKPVSDKGLYGWIYRVYPEPFQVVLQTVEENGRTSSVKNTIVYTSDKKPTYNEAVSALLQV